MRLLVACQDTGIYIFEIGAGSPDMASKNMPCQDLWIGREEAEGAVDELRPSAQQREVRPPLETRQTRRHSVARGDGGRMGVITVVPSQCGYTAGKSRCSALSLWVHQSTRAHAKGVNSLPAICKAHKPRDHIN